MLKSTTHLAGQLSRIAVMSINLMLATSSGQAGELVYVWGGRLADLDHFACTDIGTSQSLRRVCYDNSKAYLLIELQDKWLHYCEVEETVVGAFIAAPSAASFYNSKIRSGPFDCKGKRVPDYD